MLDITGVLSNRDEPDTVAAIYFALRYFKKNHFAPGEKTDDLVESRHFFQDDLKSLPSSEIRDLTIKIIDAIELALGKKAKQLDDRSVLEVLRYLTDVAISYEENLSKEDLATAQSIMDQFDEEPNELAYIKPGAQ